MMRDPDVIAERVRNAREYMRDQAEQSSIRVLAGLVGVNPSTLHSFLSGATPHPPLRRKLLAWYAEQVDGDPGGVQAALDMLLLPIPEEERAGAKADVLGALAIVYRSRGVEPPGWTQAGHSAVRGRSLRSEQ